MLEGVEKKEDQHPNLLILIEQYIERYKAGSPTDSSVYWIHYQPKELATMIFEETGIYVSNSVVKRVLKKASYRYRKLRKTLSTGTFEYRNEQFEIIFQLIGLRHLGTPLISIDCKKKECLGNFYRDGKVLCTKSLEVFDHDYSHLSEGKVIPHGIYDLQMNKGYISIGKSHETASFIGDNILWWWDNYGIHNYPMADKIIILCDAGGGNSYRHHAFKKEILKLAKTIGKDIIVCHYPPYASKWNPIEHRLFAHVHRAMQGVIFTDYDIIKELIEKTSTKNGLEVVVRLNLEDYEIGIKTDKSEVDFDRIQFNQKIPSLSYRIAA